MKLTEEQITRIVELTKAGWSAVNLAKEFNCSTRTIERVRTRMEANVSAPPTPVPLDKLKRAAELLEDDDVSIYDVAHRLGIDSKTLYRKFPNKRRFTRREAGLRGGAVARYIRFERTLETNGNFAR